MALRAGVSERRRQGRRVARLLAPAAARAGGFASAEARARVRPGVTLRPDVCVAVGEPPYDGILLRAPLLVVVLGVEAEAAAWLALGAVAVWSPAGPGARLHVWGGTTSWLPPDGLLVVPGCPGLELRAGVLAVAGAASAVAPDPPGASRAGAPALRPVGVLR